MARLLITTHNDPCTKGVKRAVFFARFLGDGFPYLTELTLRVDLRSPYLGTPDVITGSQSWVSERAIKFLLGKFPMLQKLTVQMAGPCLEGDRAYDLVRSG